MNYEKLPKTISAEELLSTPLPPVKWIIPDLLPAGLALFAGPSKAGKSWLTLWLCLQVAQGKPMWGREIEPHTVLYLSLEDTFNRLQKRLLQLVGSEEAPERLVMQTECSSIGLGLVEQLTSFLYQHPDTGLIVIDTLQKVRGSAKKDEIAYATDYRELGALKEYADNKRICVFLIHHLRKMADENDVFNMISGSNGIMGVCDTIFIIYKKKRQDENAVLFMTGRDIRQQDVVVHFDETKYRWDMVGTAEEEERKRKKREYENNPIVKTVKDLLKQYPMGWKGTATDLIKAVYDVTGSPCIYSTAALGKEITSIETQLYYDGIEHSMKRSGSSRVHYFGKRQAYKPTYQRAIFDESED